MTDQPLSPACPDLRAQLAAAVQAAIRDSGYWLPADGQAAAVGAAHAVVSAPGYCPHCGRGDCAPTADEYEQLRQRAETAEATLRAVRLACEVMARRGRASEDPLLRIALTEAARIIASEAGWTLEPAGEAAP